jgi:hypothetical protein
MEEGKGDLLAMEDRTGRDKGRERRDYTLYLCILYYTILYPIPMYYIPCTYLPLSMYYYILYPIHGGGADGGG